MNTKPIIEQEKQIHGDCVKSFCFHGLSWTAIIAGAFVAIGLSFLLNLFDIGIGLSAFSTATTEKGAHALAFGGYIAMVIGVMVSMFVAGWVSGFIAKPKCISGCHGILYGFLTWCLALILSFFLVGHATQFINYQYRALSNSNTTHFRAASIDAFPTATYTKNETEATKTTTEINDEKAAKVLAESVFLLFILFFSSALAACFGGYTAVKNCNKYDYNDEERKSILK